MKRCKTCNQEHPESMFHKNGASGLHPECKMCKSAKLKAKRAANPERYRELDKARYERDREKRRAANKAYCEMVGEERREKERQRYAANAESRKAQVQTYREHNKARVYEWNGSRRARSKMAVPPWCDAEEVRAIYAEARALSQASGVAQHVDHIIPLVHPLVCGLHVPENLQIVPAVENLRKGQRFVCA